MGLTVKNKTSYELGNNLTEFFQVPIEEPIEQDEYSRLKDDIYELDLDIEEKANILNKINSLSISKKINERKKIQKEIEKFKKEHNL